MISRTADATAEPDQTAAEPPEAAEIDWNALEPVEAEARRPADGLAFRLTVRFDGRTVDALTREAHRLGVGPGTLVRMWTLERLRALGALVDR